ncbi:F-actin capping protein, alpha subunit [Rhizoctonia solani AG-1 IA]|uniref:F-actin-capping protein subunit alpha n=1 Tax=Thanatephorus cucumeris (strain AG1-IA) TaxID=983506 RepID=L8X0Y2_THACA|nr:F-actin capping protein, alpha subunit [Rhizoctonia solani AG-1 IA]
MDASQRLSSAASFILQSPPGEINDVISDLRTIVNDDDALQEGIQSSLEKYNQEQFVCVNVPDQEHQVIVSNAGLIPESGRFLDPRSKTSFVFDHLTLAASEPEPVEIDAESEPFRSGRWRSEYTIDLNKGEVLGKVFVNVHYYEQGNTAYTPTFSVPTDLTPSAAPKILAIISEKEGEHERALGDAYADLGEKSFKSLRRALPLTRQKLDWDKVLGYKLGAELTASRGAFGTA